jgi:hypothetical protein
MKKLHYFFILFLLCAFAFTSCQKDKAEIKDESTNSEVAKITRQLQIFKQNLQSKSGETMPADSAEWYLEGLLNYEQANNSHVFSDVDFYHDTLTVTVTDGQINLDELNNLYNSIDAWAETIKQQSGNDDFTYDIVDLNLITTGLKSGTQNILVSLSGGIIGSGLNYIPFGTTDYWYWGKSLGKCGAFTGLYEGRDATTELQRKFRNPIAFPGAGYFTSVQFVYAMFYDFPDDNNPFGLYMLFYASGNGETPPYEPCLSPEELNYYLSKFDYIKSVKQIPGKTYKTVEVVEDYGGGYGWEYLHDYKLYYGFKIEFAE